MRLLKQIKKEHIDRHLPRSHQCLLAGLLPLVVALAFFPKAESNQNLARDFVALGPAVPADYLAPAPDPVASLLEEATPVVDPRLWLEVKPGDSLSVIFRRAGLG